MNLDTPERDCMAGTMDKTRGRVLDEFLVLRCQEGGREAYDLLIRRWQRRLWRYARRLTGSHDAAWDITQETWLVVLRQVRSLSDPAWFAAWVYRIVRNKCADYCRRVGRRRRLADALAERQRTDDRPVKDDPIETVAEALRHLPRDRQELLTLKYGGDLNIVEIAVILGIPAGTVKSRLHYAREQLREILRGEDP
jgi:RNA polymerase sigma-70 factor (ECF subfamily)